MALLRILLLLFCMPQIASGSPRDLAALDRQVAAQFPQISYRIATSIGRPDQNGWIGRNREWGGYYSVRFQYGAGRALRYGIAIQDKTIIRLAHSAMRAGLRRVEPDGSFPASLPTSLFPGVALGPPEHASAAAFFLSDICPAYMIAGPGPLERRRISAAINWLTSQQHHLMRSDHRAPNRLVIDALAFGSCGTLVNDKDALAASDLFLRRALTLVDENGVFKEAGGSDTSYQSVATMAGLEIATLGVAGPQQTDLRATLERASGWLVDRIGPDGRLDVSRNTRTCAQEEFLGRPKDVDLKEVFRALAYADLIFGSQSDTLKRYSDWLRSEPEPC